MPSDEFRKYLDQVEGNLTGSGKGDILREIESHIFDRAEAVAAARGGEIEDGDLEQAISEMGDPSTLALSYSGEKHLVTPKEYASFWYFTGLLFSVHLVMLLFAAVTRTQFSFFPFNVLPFSRLEGAGAVLVVVSLAVQAFLFDAGLVVMVFFLLRRTFRRVELPNLTFRVETSRRPSLFRAAFAVAFMVLFGLPGVRSTLLTVKLSPASEDVYTPLLPGFHEVLPYLMVFLALSFLKDMLYAFLRERTGTVMMDALTWIAGVALCIHVFATEEIFGLPADFPLEEEKIRLFNAVMDRVLGLFLLVLGALFASRAVKRLVRLRQLWGEARPEEL